MTKGTAACMHRVIVKPLRAGRCSFQAKNTERLLPAGPVPHVHRAACNRG